MFNILSLRFWACSILSTGLLGLIGWLSIPALTIYAVIAILKYRGRKTFYTPFYGIACAQYCLFALTNCIYVIISCPMFLPSLNQILLFYAQILLSLCFEMIVVAILVALVALFTRTKPQLSTGLLACLWITIADILLLISSTLIAISELPSGR